MFKYGQILQSSAVLTTILLPYFQLYHLPYYSCMIKARMNYLTCI